MNGFFIVLEGPDGAGKTTQRELLVKRLQAKGYDVVVTREPGGTPLGEKIRDLLLHEPMGGLAEVLMFAASRAEHIRQVILPALETGKVVVCDRFTDSSYAYQAEGRGLYDEMITVEKLVLKGFPRHLWHTLYFDITFEESERRLNARRGQVLDRLDAEVDEFKHRVFAGYERRCKCTERRGSVTIIPSMGTVDEIENHVNDWIENWFVHEMPVPASASLSTEPTQTT